MSTRPTWVFCECAALHQNIGGLRLIRRSVAALPVELVTWRDDRGRFTVEFVVVCWGLAASVCGPQPLPGGAAWPPHPHLLP
jgi:hypothetical protein